MEEKLKPLRDQIDTIDMQLLEVLNRRARVVQEIGYIKEAADSPVYRPEREAQILRNVVDRNPGPLPNADVQSIFIEIMSSCRALEKRVTVAYLGPAGTYSELAVYQKFGHAVKTLPCATIDEVFRSTEAGTSDFGIVPIENSTEGTINRTLDLLMRTSLTISAEVVIPIHHSLMTASGSMEGVHTIYAHSQALAQCQGWLNQKYPHTPRQAVSSNGEAAMMASKDVKTAAIASEMAGEHYGLRVVHAHIQDEPNNKTRFAVIGQYETEPSGKDQTSLVLSVPNEAGSVYRLLEPLAKHGVSMTRFESRPAKTGSWEYYFYMDIEGHIKDKKVAAALTWLQKRSAYYKVLGSYPMDV